MGQAASNKNDTQSGNQVVLFLVKSLESAMPDLSINCDRFSSVFVRKTRQAHCYAQKNLAQNSTGAVLGRLRGKLEKKVGHQKTPENIIEIEGLKLVAGARFELTTFRL